MNIRSAISSFNMFDKISKLENHEEYLVWKRSIRDVLTFLNYWRFIDEISSENQIQKQLVKWDRECIKICIILRLCVKINVYNDIENMKNFVVIWNKLEKNFQSRDSNFFNDAFRKLNDFTLIDCISSSDYVSRFRLVVNELQRFFIKMKLNENWLIYRFHFNLNSNHSAYFESYSQNHESFKTDDILKHTLNFVMQRFENIVKNLVKINVSVVIMFVVIASEMKMIKHCTHCDKDFHIKEECRKKHFHLKTQFETIDEYENQSNKRKWDNRDDHRQDKRQRKSQNDRRKETISKDTSLLIVDWFSVFVVMIAVISATTISLFFLWTWDIDITQHVCHNRFVFIFYESLLKSTSIKNLREHVQVIKIDEVHLRCVKRNDVSKTLMLHRTTHVLNQKMNLIFQKQIHRRNIRLTITNQEIEIDASKILTRLMQNNLYFMNLHQISSILSLIVVNENALKMWHSRLEHLSNVNIKKLINMFTEIDLSKSSIENVCKTCVVTQIRFKSHKIFIELDRYSFDLIHSDVQESFF
jgi:hypothetical protein